MSRYFSSAARAALQFIWKGTVPNPKYETIITDKITKNARLQDVDRIEIAGQEHTSPKDSADRVSGQVFKGDARLTSLHAYKDGTVVFSKEEYNAAQEQ